VAASVFCISSTLNYLDRLLLASVAPLIIKEFHLTNEAYGWLLSGLALAYALAAPFNGALLDRLGLNKGASLAVGTWSIICAATSFVRDFGTLAAARIALGLAESAGIPVVAKMNVTYLLPRERAVGAAISQVGLSLGGVLAPVVVYWMLPKYGWRAPFVFAGALGLLWIPLWLLASRLIPSVPSTAPGSEIASVSAWREPKIVILGCVNILSMSTYVLWSNFTTLLLTHNFHETTQSAAAYAWFPPLAASLGGFAGGWLSLRLIRGGMDPVEARTRGVLCSAIGCLVTLAVPFAPSSLIATLLIGASYFATVAGSVNVYTIPLDLFGASKAAAATSVLVSAYGLLQIFLSPVIGKLVDSYGFAPVCVLVSFPPLLGYLLLRVGITARRGVLAALLLFIGLAAPHPARAYSVLTHEAIVDTVWLNAMQPALLKRFPGATPEQLKDAHAYAYGGCIIQDMGYYPFGSRFFSDLVHYVRSADFVQALLDESRDLNEYGFAMGAVAHYGADIEGHSIAVNRTVPILYPELRKKFGNQVTYADNPTAHLKTEFGFDVLQVARGHYAPQAYHDFIGFEVSKDLLDRAFQRTYGLKLKDLFLTLDLALGTYRFSVSTMLPGVTKTAWALKTDEIHQLQPGVSRRQFLYNIRRASFEKEWGRNYKRPGFGTRVMAFLLHLLPRVGPLKGLSFKVPTPATERMFEDSFNASVQLDRESFAEAGSGMLKVANRDLDTGKPVTPGEYVLTDKSYDKLLAKLAEKKFNSVTPELRTNILEFYGHMKSPDRHGMAVPLAALRAIPDKSREAPTQ
jgi:MFS family permease